MIYYNLQITFQFDIFKSVVKFSTKEQVLSLIFIKDKLYSTFIACLTAIRYQKELKLNIINFW